MPSDLTIPLESVYAFALVLIRVAGVLVFIPIPGVTASPAAARIVLSLAFTFALSSRWPVIDPTIVTTGVFLVWIVSEAAFGIAAGVLVGLIAEAIVMGAQILGLQAGYGYASTIDPNTQADSGILLVMAQLFAGMLFFALGLDRQLVLIFARSLEAHPPGSWLAARPAAEELIRIGSSVFSTGLRLALPVAGMLLLVDLALALVGRINAQVQMISVAFPVKMALALFILAWTLAAFPRVYEQHANGALELLARIMIR
ncbi:MAG TPA: flagellar biosynthetic protein FliR [Bryobacteraceae bacterium]|nr:flagellar biosynthetic protein FliR [Bryobacteraceae bacterium]